MQPVTNTLTGLHTELQVEWHAFLIHFVQPILDVIKRSGFEALLITTFNATLAFYEEVVLRLRIAAGHRYNLVLTDVAQCMRSWTSEAGTLREFRASRVEPRKDP